MTYVYSHCIEYIAAKACLTVAVSLPNISTVSTISGSGALPVVHSTLSELTFPVVRRAESQNKEG